MQFLRAGNVGECVVDMRNRVKEPVKIRPGEDNDLSVVWDNSVPILTEFCIRYLAKEGMEETSEGADDIFAYAFHGKYHFKRSVKKGEPPKTVAKPILHALHFNLTAHRSRFMTDVEVHFKELFKLLDKHPAWSKFLDDKGSGSPPTSYCMAVEQGVRSYAFASNAKLTMGIGKTRTVTKDVYNHIHAWRKTECYISGVRFRRERPSYRKWEDFSWLDFVERQNLSTTFLVRHLPYSDGEDHFGGLLKDPPEWGGVVSPVKKKSRGGKPSKVKTEPQNQTKKQVVPMRFDVNKGSLVPVIDLS